MIFSCARKLPVHFFFLENLAIKLLQSVATWLKKTLNGSRVKGIGHEIFYEGHN